MEPKDHRSRASTKRYSLRALETMLNNDQGICAGWFDSSPFLFYVKFRVHFLYFCANSLMRKGTRSCMYKIRKPLVYKEKPGSVWNQVISEWSG